MLGLLAATLLLGLPQSSEISFPGFEGVTLKGTLVVPASRKSVPAVVLLPGSGPTDRDGNSPQAGVTTDLLKMIAEDLAKRGIASLRFDKRATPGYRSVWPKTMAGVNDFFRFDAFIGDATFALKRLRETACVDRKRVGMVGHSEGALITLEVAAAQEAKGEPLGAIGLLGCMGRPMDQVIMDQLRLKLPQQLPAAQVKSYIDYAQSALDAARAKKPFPPNAPPGLQGLFNPSVQSLIEGYVAADPVALAKSYMGDAIVINGEFDNQVLATKDTGPLFEALSRRKRGTVEKYIVPKASHNLKASPSAMADTFSGPIAGETLSRLGSFLSKRL